MRDDIDFRAAQVVLLRAAVLPLPGGTEGAVSDPGSAAGAGLRAWTARLAADPSFMAAVALASPSLADDVRKVLDGAELKEKRLRRVAVSLAKYHLRMTHRPTPFGLFAGVALAEFGPRPALELGSAHRSRSRPDAGWLEHVLELLHTTPGVLERTRLIANDLRTVRDGRLVLTDSHDATGTRRLLHSVRLTAVVSSALERAAEPVTWSDLVGSLLERFPEAPDNAVERCVGQLVRARFLLSDLTPPPDCPDPLAHLDRRLDGFAHPLADALREIRTELAALDAAPVADKRPALAAAVARMRALHPAEDLVQSDLALDARAVLPQEVAREAERAATALWRTSLIAPGSPHLRDYHLRFLERYGTERAVPVLELLDEARGLGLPESYRRREGAAPEPHPQTARRDRLLGELFLRATGRQAVGRQAVGRHGAGRHGAGTDPSAPGSVPEVRLDEEDLRALAPSAPRRPPASLELGVELLADSWEALCAGDFRLLLGMNPGSPMAGTTFGRFAHVLGERAPDLREFAVREKEAATGFAGAAGAERLVSVAYRPRVVRSTNVAAVPQWLPLRVPLDVGPAATPGTGDVRIADLAVHADLARLRLVNTATGQPVRPVSYSMLNPATGHLPHTARFLLELGQEGQEWCIPWNWGAWSAAPVQPRVTYGRTVLAPAQWLLDRQLLDAAALRDGGWPREVARWRQRWSVPRHVMLTRADNRITVDLDDPLHLIVFQDEARKGTGLLVRERVEGPRASRWLSGTAGAHAGELVIPLFASRAGGPEAGGAVETAAADVVRPARRGSGPSVHVPGGEWLYAKLYVPEAQQAQVLGRHLGRLTGTELMTAAGVDSWFFLRYADPDPHLRLRFHGKPGPLWGVLLPALRQWTHELRDAGLAGNLVLDTYDPETERYGGAAAIGHAERVFHADSAVVLHRLGRPPAVGDRLPEQVGAALGILGLLTRLGTAHEALAWLGNDALLARRSEVPREHKQLVAGLLDASGRPVPERLAQGPDVEPTGLWAGRGSALDALREVLESAEAAPVDTTRARASGAEPGADTADGAGRRSVALSLAHMHCNRVFGPQRETETLAHVTAREGLALALSRRRHGV
ncbi:lantibiotic dehydratase [Streptomyces sp. NPDC055663]